MSRDEISRPDSYFMKLYAVRNKEGKYFRAIGYGGYGRSWVETLEKAKFYSKIGQAKARVTYFFKSGPEFGCPEILEFDLNVENAQVINMEEITKKNISKIEEKKLKREIYWRNREIKRLEVQKQEIAARCENLRSKNN